ncbi:MAG: nicotinate-nucleotide adenylyltransferase [Actinobacteria bacterium]|nr:nicotinate-nucleotide adenylyltransferase [Actinomycetota bacterium]
MGGTFDPIHVGHLVAASEVLHGFSLDCVVFMPAGDPWQKTSEAPAEDRLMMTSLAVAGVARFAVSRLELDRKGPTYTADSLEMLADFYGSDVRFFLIAGADAVLNLSTWKKLDTVRDLAEIVAVSRPGSALDEFRASDDLPKVHVQHIPGIDISATEIRDRVRRGRPIDFLVPREVAHYIAQHGLYSAPAERSA